MRVVIISPYWIGNEYTEDRIEYENVTNCQFEYQPNNGKSYWFYMEFKENSKEYNLFKDNNGGTLYIEIDPKKDEIYISQD